MYMQLEEIQANGRTHIIAPQKEGRKGKMPDASYMGRKGYILVAITEKNETFQQWLLRKNIKLK
jgi:hypothetical protein